MKTQFAINMIRLRRSRLMTQEEAAERIGIKRCTIGAYEEGRAHPSFETLFKICQVYKVKNVEDLIWGEVSIVAKVKSRKLINPDRRSLINDLNNQY